MTHPGGTATGRAPEPLVLLPGTLCDGRMWGPVLRHLDHPLAVVRVLAGADSAAVMAASLLRDLPQRFALAGFSLGGIVALEMMAQAPHRVSRLALIDTTARPDPDANHLKRRNAVARAGQLGLQTYVGDKLWATYASEGADPALKRVVTEMGVTIGLDTFRDQSELAISRADSRPRLARITVPTLVLCGEADRLCPVEVHREMAASIPGARLVVVPRAGHFAPLEQPEPVARAMADWLATPMLTRAAS